MEKHAAALQDLLSTGEPYNPCNSEVCPPSIQLLRRKFIPEVKSINPSPSSVTGKVFSGCCINLG
jgi:hypothetical protein